MLAEGGDFRQYLKPEVLARVGSLELKARLVVEGSYTGMHRSPFHGLSVEYADHRPYVQGDDVRHIDWKVFGRTDKYYIKQYEQETNLECMLVVDCSESMTYRSSAVSMTKHEYAMVVAASLAYLAVQKQRDSVGLATFDEGLNRYLKPSRNPTFWQSIIRELEGEAGPSKTGIRKVLDDVGERLERRTLIILISDLFDDVAEILKGLWHLRHHGHEVIVCRIWDPDEYDFPFQGPTLFQGLEEAGSLLTEPRSLRDRYLQQVKEFTSRLRSGCHRLKVDFAPFRTSTPLDVAISAYLAARSNHIRARSSRVLGRG